MLTKSQGRGKMPKTYRSVLSVICNTITIRTEFMKLSATASYLVKFPLNRSYVLVVVDSGKEMDALDYAL